MSKKSSIVSGIMLLAVLASMASAKIVTADTIYLRGTGAGVSAEGRGNNVVFDPGWKAGFLGSHEIGFEASVGHDGTQLNNPFVFLDGQFSHETLLSHLREATLTEAFVYDNLAWPLNMTGSIENAWSNLERNYPGSAWIGEQSQYSVSDGEQGELATHTAGYYAYQLEFTIQPGEEGQYSLSGMVAADNALLGILIDDSLLHSSDGDDAASTQPFDICKVYDFDFFLDAGDHRFTLITSNYGNDRNYGNPAGLWTSDIKLTNRSITTVTPEPGTMAVCGLSLLGVGLLARRRFSKKME